MRGSGASLHDGVGGLDNIGPVIGIAVDVEEVRVGGKTFRRSVPRIKRGCSTKGARVADRIESLASESEAIWRMGHVLYHHVWIDAARSSLFSVDSGMYRMCVGTGTLAVDCL